MSLTKLEIVESDEQNPDPIDKIIKLEMLSSSHAIYLWWLVSLDRLKVDLKYNHIPGIDVISRIGFHSLSPVSFDDEIDILLTVKTVRIKLPNRFARKVPRGYRFHPFKYTPRKWRLNPPNGARIIASHNVRFDGLNMIRQIPRIKSTRVVTAGNAKWILLHFWIFDKIGFVSFPIKRTPIKQRIPSGQLRIDIPLSYPDLKFGKTRAIACWSFHL